MNALSRRPPYSGLVEVLCDAHVKEISKGRVIPPQKQLRKKKQDLSSERLSPLRPDAANITDTRVIHSFISFIHKSRRVIEQSESHSFIWPCRVNLCRKKGEERRKKGEEGAMRKEKKEKKEENRPT